MPLPEVLESVRSWRYHLNTYNQQAWRTQANAWVQLERDITAEAMAFRRAHPNPMTSGELYRLERYNHLIDDVRGYLQQYAYSTGVLTQEHTRAVMDQAIFHARDLMSNAANAVGFSRVNRDNIESAVGLTREGSVLYNHLQRTSNIALMDFQRNLVRGIGLGYNPRKMARYAVNEGLGASYSRFSTIFRTETLRVARNTILESFRGNTQITGYRRLSALDRRSCIGCIVAHGRTYPVDVNFEEHPNGRCTLVPIFGDDDDWEPKYDGENWFRSQTPDIQREILGPGRYELFNSGKATFNQLATLKEDAIWGNSIVRTPVSALKRGEGGIPFIQPQARPSPAALNALPAATPEATQTLGPLEEKIRNIHTHEQAYIVGGDGRLIAHVIGSIGSVNLGPALSGHSMEQRRSYSTTHNHPSGFAAFSEVDLSSFFRLGIRELRTVATDGTWSFKHADLSGRRKTLTWFERTYNRLLPQVRQSVVTDLRSGALNPNIPPSAHAMHRMSKALAEESKGKLIYERVSTSTD